MKRFSDMKIKWKLICGFGFVLLLTLGVGAFAIMRLNDVANKTETTDGLLDRYSDRTTTLNNALLLGYQVLKTTGSLSMYLQAEDQQEQQALFARFDRDEKEFDRLMKTVRKYGTSPEEVKKIGEIEDMRNIVKAEAIDLIAIRDGEGEYGTETKDAVADYMNSIDSFTKKINEFVLLENSSMTEIQKESKDISAEANTTATRAITIMIAVVLLAVVAGIIVSLWLSRIITKPIYKAVDVATKVAGGDLTQSGISVDSRDEIGELLSAMDSMRIKLNDMIAAIANNSTASAVESIKSSMDSLLQGADKQSESIDDTSGAINQMGISIKSVAEATESLSQSAEESSSAMLEMTASTGEIAEHTHKLTAIVDNVASSIEEAVASIKQVTGNVESVSGAADETSATVNQFSVSLKSVEDYAGESALLSEKVKEDAANLGTRAVQKTLEGMNLITESVGATSSIVNRLGERSSQIGKVLTVISDVTDQTNLLSLNASIIAAQAGEHGRSFAVVADAIRDLAEETASSTTEIATIIEAIQKEVKEVVISMKKVSDSALKGMDAAEESGNILNGIVESSDKSSQMTWKIKEATKEQGMGVAQINESTIRIAEMIKQTAVAMNEQGKAMSHIMGAAEEMKGIFRRLRQATVEQAKGSEDITNTVEQVNQKAKSIAIATKEQQNGSRQIELAAEQIKGITQQNLDLASAVNHAIETLTKQAELLDAEIKKFRV